MTRSARAGTARKFRRVLTHPGCTAAVLIVAIVVLLSVGAETPARVVALLSLGLTALPVVAVLLASPPLPKVHAKSLLTERLAWLGRFAVAAFLLCAAGVLSVYFTHEFTRQDETVDADVRLATAAAEVAEAAAVLGLAIFIVWLIVDLARLRPEGRARAVTTTLRKPADGQLARWACFAVRPAWVLLLLVAALATLGDVVINLGD